MSDVLHRDVPDVFVDRIFGEMGRNGQHIFQVLTCRADEALRQPAVTMNRGALGYVGSYFVRNQPGLILSFDGVLPTPENIRSHRYAFSTDEHLYTRSGGSPEARAFATFVAAQRALLNSSGIY